MARPINQPREPKAFYVRTLDCPRKTLRVTRLCSRSLGPSQPREPKAFYVAPHAALIIFLQGVLRVRVEVGERLGVLHWLLDGLEEAVVGTFAGRLARHEIPRSVETYLLRGVHGARRRRRPREIPEEWCRPAFPALPITSLSQAVPSANWFEPIERTA